jgi:hypothetical protein
VVEGSTGSARWSLSLSEEKGDFRASVGVPEVEHLKAAEQYWRAQQQRARRFMGDDYRRPSVTIYWTADGGPYTTTVHTSVTLVQPVSKVATYPMLMELLSSYAHLKYQPIIFSPPRSSFITVALDPPHRRHPNHILLTPGCCPHPSSLLCPDRRHPCPSCLPRSGHCRAPPQLAASILQSSNI